jgi:esterase/lipase superfamily enzyme
MARTVYFVTNRAVTGDPTQWQSYGTDIVPPADPSALTYGTAFVDDSNLTADSAGSISSLQDIRRGSFNDDAVGDLSAPGCNLLFFIHGFDNSFNDGITRAAYLQQWFAASGIAGANTKVLAFGWPSLGQAVSLPIPWSDYLRDQAMAGHSGIHLMDVLVRLQPILAAARKSGARTILLAHSMGNWALAAGVSTWFLQGQGPAALFDEAILAAADEVADSFTRPPPMRLSRLSQLAGRISTYYSRADMVLQLSATINGGVVRLGHDGPPHRTDTTLFPQPGWRMVDCSTLHDYDDGILNSHQYYRRSPAARADIAAVIAGTAGDVPMV